MFFTKKQKDTKPELSIEELETELERFIETKKKENEDYIETQKQSLSKEPSKLELLFDDGYKIIKEFYDDLDIHTECLKYNIDKYGKCYYSVFITDDLSKFYYRKYTTVVPASFRRQQFINKLQQEKFIDLEDSGRLTNVNNILQIRKL